MLQNLFMKLLLSACLLVLAYAGYGQSTDAVSPEEELKLATTDTSRIKALLKLSAVQKSFDSAFLYADEALALSKEKKWELGEASSYKRRGDIFFDLANYPKSLDNYITSLRIYERLDNVTVLPTLFNSIANVYARQDDFITALDYYRASARARVQIGQDERGAFFGIGRAHEFNDNLDSALIYYQRAYEFFQATPTNPRTPFILIHLADVHRKKKNDLLALSYARMAGSYVKYSKDSVGISSIYSHLAEIYHETGNRDSAIYYAEKSFKIAERIQNDDPKVEPALLLSELYENDPAKAYKYYRIAKTIQDSMFSRKKLLETQRISYEERERQKELSEAKLQGEITRRNNIQYGAIGLGLAITCLVFLLLSRSFIVNERAVKFLGILILLMVFEFLNLVLHPYIGNLTHHSPILMLLAMVAIASLLIPTHHHLEHWVTKKMVQKNKKVRLQTAKKIVERLEKENVNSSAY